MGFLASGFPRNIQNAVLASILLTSLAAVMVSSFQFEVGGKNGWTKPTGNESETYNEWAVQNRFRIGDTLYFKYKNDSVEEVSASDYLTCNVSNPIVKFRDGETVFPIRRSGWFYFISGRPSHCKAGQKLTIRVLHPTEATVVSAPEPAASSPAEGGHGWDSHSMGHNSTSKLSLVSYFITALGGVMVLLYLLI